MSSASFQVQTTAEREAALLARYAMHSAASRGRKHAEPEHPYRGPFQRDRDRILHCGAFRRLSGKTQVFMGNMGDYHRTRLTHTHEVASIARTIGRALRLNEDLTEALALFHDIGHPPFGHAGEDALDECLREHGGFSHNRYALTIAEELESRYAHFRGLNLTYEVLDGQATRADKKATYSAKNPAPLLEVQVVEAADSMTYDAHDSDDAVKLRLVSLDELAANSSLVRDALEAIHQTHADVRDDLLRKAVVHQLIDRQVTDVLQNVTPQLAAAESIWEESGKQCLVRIEPGPELAEQKRELEVFLYDQVYRHPRLVAVRSTAQDRLRNLFRAYTRQPELLPAPFQERAARAGLPRAVGDYVAGMTDRFCDQQYDLVVAAQL